MSILSSYLMGLTLGFCAAMFSCFLLTLFKVARDFPDVD